MQTVVVCSRIFHSTVWLKPLIGISGIPSRHIKMTFLKGNSKKCRDFCSQRLDYFF